MLDSFFDSLRAAFFLFSSDAESPKQCQAQEVLVYKTGRARWVKPQVNSLFQWIALDHVGHLLFVLAACLDHSCWIALSWSHAWIKTVRVCFFAWSNFMFLDKLFECVFFCFCFVRFFFLVRRRSQKRVRYPMYLKNRMYLKNYWDTLKNSFWMLKNPINLDVIFHFFSKEMCLNIRCTC